MIASAPTRRATITVANPQAEPSQAWVRAMAVMLLAHVDREIAAERAAGTEDGQDGGQDGGQDA